MSQDVIKYATGNGKVVLIAGGNKVYTDIAARFCRSEKSVEEIVASPYNANIVKKIIESGHLAATEFDYWIFGVEGYSRVCETQLVRKRLANYLIKSGRVELKGRRKFEVSVPSNIENFYTTVKVMDITGEEREISVDSDLLLELTSKWYDAGIERNIPEEDLRYMKPQATTFKAIIGMNSHALLDWFKIRCCKRAQKEIRHMACQMLAICKKHSPDIFAEAGPSCVSLGYCPENELQHPSCKDNVKTKAEVMKILKVVKDSHLDAEAIKELIDFSDDMK